MDYCIEICSLYDTRKIRNKSIIIFNDHNMALPAWGTIRQDYDTPLKLITFDTHADTHAAFAREIGKSYFVYDERTCNKFKRDVLSALHCEATDFNFEDVFKLSVDMVVNDEHIFVADYFDYINGYVVFCNLSIDEVEDFQSQDRSNGSDATYYTKHKIKEMTDEEITLLCTSPFILDFDLDYFTSPEMFSNEFKEKISVLIRKASAITIAREPDFFKKERSDVDFTNEQALEMLLHLIFEILEFDVD